jgi:hypothetical protein
MERIADRILRTVAPWIITLMGVIVVGAGALAVGASTEPGALGADVSLLLGGLGVAFLGLLMVLRVRHDLVRTGLAAVTTGFFAVQLAAFEAGTRRCDINPALADCGGIVVDQQPYAIFGAPMLLAAILLIYLVFEPFARRRDGTDATAVAVAGAAPVTAVAASTPQPPGGTASADPLSHEMSATTLAATGTRRTRGLHGVRRDGRRSARWPRSRATRQRRGGRRTRGGRCRRRRRARRAAAPALVPADLLADVVHEDVLAEPLGRRVERAAPVEARHPVHELGQRP